MLYTDSQVLLCKSIHLLRPRHIHLPAATESELQIMGRNNLSYLL